MLSIGVPKKHVWGNYIIQHTNKQEYSQGSILWYMKPTTKNYLICINPWTHPSKHGCIHLIMNCNCMQSRLHNTVQKFKIFPRITIIHKIMELGKCLQNHKTMAIKVRFISNDISMLAKKSPFYDHKYDCLCQLYI